MASRYGEEIEGGRVICRQSGRWRVGCGWVLVSCVGSSRGSDRGGFEIWWGCESKNVCDWRVRAHMLSDDIGLLPSLLLRHAALGLFFV